MKRRLALLGIWLLCGLGGLLVWTFMLTQVLANTKRAWTLAIAWDDLGNVALGGRLGQTISTKCALACQRNVWWGCAACKILDWINPGHCQRAAAAGSPQNTVVS